MSRKIPWWLFGKWRKKAANALLDDTWTSAGHGEIWREVKTALESGADPNMRISNIGWKPIEAAFYNGEIKAARLLLKAGATLDEKIVTFAYLELADTQFKYDNGKRAVAKLIADEARKLGIYEKIVQKQLDLEEERARSVEAVKEYYQPLFELLEAAWIWGEDNNHPSLQEYPQVEELRAIGKSIGDLGGKAYMSQSLSKAKEMARLKRDYLGGYTAVAEKAWNGIHDWQY